MSVLLLATALALTNVADRAGSPAPTNAVTTARITSDSTYYDRKEGIAVFKGHVHVDDAEYQMHAERAYLFLTGTNDLSRIAATGSVALTNGQRRAYGERATYNREKGVVTLTGAPGKPAIVAEDTPEGVRMVQGRKIRFWVSQEQVEVVEAVIDAPRTGSATDLPGLLK